MQSVPNSGGSVRVRAMTISPRKKAPSIRASFPKVSYEGAGVAIVGTLAVRVNRLMMRRYGQP